MSAPDPRRWPIWPWVALVAAGLVIATVAAFVSDATGSEESAAPAATQTITQTVTQSVTATVPAAQAPTPAPPSPAGPAAQFGDGSHVVGLDVMPGIYRTEGPSGTNPGGCYWSRRKADGSSITDYDVSSGPGRITINGGELVEVNGCKPWVKA